MRGIYIDNSQDETNERLKAVILILR